MNKKSILVLIIAIILLPIVYGNIFGNLFELFREVNVEKEAKIKLIPESIMANDLLTIKITPGVSGYYKQIYFYKNNKMVDSITLDCVSICATEKIIQYKIPINWQDEYTIYVFDFSIKDYVGESFDVESSFGTEEFSTQAIGTNLAVNPSTNTVNLNDIVDFRADYTRLDNGKDIGRLLWAKMVGNSFYTLAFYREGIGLGKDDIVIQQNSEGFYNFYDKDGNFLGSTLDPDITRNLFSGDLDNDGYENEIIAAILNGVEVYERENDNTLWKWDAANGRCEDIVIDDLNSDNYNDVTLICRGNTAVRLGDNNGDGSIIAFDSLYNINSYPLNPNDIKILWSIPLTRSNFTNGYELDKGDFNFMSSRKDYIVGLGGGAEDDNTKLPPINYDPPAKAYVVDYDGRPVCNTTDLGWETSGVASGNIDGNILNYNDEFVISAYDKSGINTGIHAFRVENEPCTHLWGPINVCNGNIAHEIVMADLDNNGYKDEVIVGCKNYGVKAYKVDSFGIVNTIFDYSNSDADIESLIVTDINNDNKLEIIAADSDLDDGSYVYSFDNIGNFMWKFKTNAALSNSENGPSRGSDPALDYADVNSDLSNDIGFIGTSMSATYSPAILQDANCEVQFIGENIWKKFDWFDYSSIDWNYTRSVDCCTSNGVFTSDLDWEVRCYKNDYDLQTQTGTITVNDGNCPLCQGSTTTTTTTTIPESTTTSSTTISTTTSTTTSSTTTTSITTSTTTSTTSTTTTIFQIELQQGWNLIGIPYAEADPRVESVFSEILNKLVTIYSYITPKKWEVYHNSQSIPYHLFTVNDRQGYWVKVNQSATLINEGIINNTKLNYNLGWNLIAVEKEETLEQHLDANNKIKEAYNYSINNNSYTYLPKDITLHKGRGYWILVNETI